MVPEGQIVGVVGRSGSGKTTLSQILIGLRDPEAGTATLGGQRVADVVSDRGASAIALVSQEPVLLQGSISSNIAFFRDVSKADVEMASRAAHLHEDVVAMVDQYDTAVGEGGSVLSGGQRQRLAIARALVGKPRLLVLDEPTSALDGRSESLIRQTLAELHGKVTVVIISHRLAAIESCDFILVLDRGRIAGFGASNEIRTSRAFLDISEEDGLASTA
jgi:ABC-type multidrug transport system fused ATPase/permease subunit